MTKTGWIVAVAVIASLAIGCSKGSSPDKASKADKAPTAATPAPAAASAHSPKDAVLNFAKSFETHDKAMLLACVQATPQQQAALEAMFDMTTAMTGFQGKMIKAYGADALAKINMKDGSGIPKAAEIEKKLKVAETGDTALATMEGESKPLKLVKVGGGWKIDASAMMGAEAVQTEQMIAMSKIMVKIVEEISQSIGKPGTTPESINEEMGKKIMGAMAAMAPKGGQAMPKAPEVPEAPEAVPAPK